MTETITAPSPSWHPVPPPRPHRRRIVPWAVAAVVAIVGLHIALSAFMRVPVIQPDELGYLQNARFLARGGLRSETEYYPGFSLLLVALWWLSTTPTVVFHGALVIEALLCGLAAVLCWRLTRLLAPALAGWRRVVVVGVALAYPPFVLYGNFALSEVAFAVMFSVVVLLAGRAFMGGGIWSCLLLGLAAGGLALVHPRGLAVMVAVAIFGLLVLGWQRRLAGLGLGMVIGLGVTRWLVTFTKGPVAPNFGSYRPDTVISKSLSLHGLTSLLPELAGQLWYLSLATFGLVPLGLLLGGRALLRVLRGERDLVTVVQGFATLSFIGVWALSSLFMNLGDRADKLVYGRYNDAAILPLLLIALADVVRARVAGRRWLSTAIVTTVVTGLFLQLGRSSAALHGDLNPANVLGMTPLFDRMHQHIHVVPMSLIILGTVVILAIVAMRFPVVSVVALAAIFIWSVSDVQTGYLIPGTRARANQNDLVHAISALRTVPGINISCVAWDEDKLVDYNYYNDKFLLPTQVFKQFDPALGQTPCGPLVASTRSDFASRFPGAQVVTGENFLNQNLWAVPIPGDPTFSILEAGGWLSPPGGNGAAVALPAIDLQGAAITVAPVGTLTLGSGASIPLNLTAYHQQGGAPWPDVPALHTSSGVYAVAVGVRWYPVNPGAPIAGCPADIGKPVPVVCPAVELPETVLPGQHTTIHAELTAVDVNNKPLAPGAYTVAMSMFQQGVAGFSDPVLTISVNVTS